MDKFAGFWLAINKYSEYLTFIYFRGREELCHCLSLQCFVPLMKLELRLIAPIKINAYSALQIPCLKNARAMKSEDTQKSARRILRNRKSSRTFPQCGVNKRSARPLNQQKQHHDATTRFNAENPKQLDNPSELASFRGALVGSSARKSLRGNSTSYKYISAVR